MSDDPVARTPQPPSPWHESIPLILLHRIRETADCVTFTFKAANGASFAYLPGQFLTLELPLPSGPVLRCYTISSAPSRPLTLSVTVKAQAGSLATRWMLDHLEPGAVLRAYGPSGQFTSGPAPKGKYLFVSAGSGITPMLSMLSYAADRGEALDIAFVHAARSPQDIIQRLPLEAMAQRVAGLQLAFTVETRPVDTLWSGYMGRLSGPMLAQMVPDYLTREVFCCGPAPFMAMMRDIFTTAGHARDRYHEESFAPEVLAVTQAAPIATDAKAAITFARAGVTVACAPEETVLSVAKRAGFNIPSGCTFGLCGTCKTRKLSGEVVMAHNGGISESDIAAGYILACCTQPVGAISIEA